MPPPTFWNEDCPMRGPALAHAHWTACDPAKGGHPLTGATHAWTDCCHCEMNATEWELVKHNILMPPADVEARLLAIRGPEESDEDISEYMGDHLIDPDSIKREPRMATGKPDGPPWQRGRSWKGDGGLSPRDKMRLNEVAYRTAKQEP